MKDYKICFYGEIGKIMPKLFLLPLLTWSTVTWRKITLIIMATTQRMFYIIGNPAGTQRKNDVVLMSMRRDDVASTLI